MALDFEAIVFPTDISFGSSGGPEFSTTVVEISSGFERRNQNWSLSRARYNVVYGVRSSAQLRALIKFFRARRGKLQAFLYKDWTDFTVTGEELGVGDGVETIFQLQKTYTSGSASYVRTLKKIKADTTKIYFDDEEQTSGFTVDLTTGAVTLDSPLGEDVVVSGDCEFYVVVRFDTDHLSVSLETYGADSAHDVPLIEVKV